VRPFTKKNLTTEQPSPRGVDTIANVLAGDDEARVRSRLGSAQQYLA